ncbi:MAG: LbtU family siderophore porin [Gammaproteobacteria bacterium]|nr:LbtU family siderophore porin [Gammaproteobacteria bacterium]
MKVKIIGLVIAGALLVNMAHADIASRQLNSLQAQINALNKQISYKKQSASLPMVTTDSKLPLASLSKVHFPEAVLKAKESYQAPLILGGQLEADAQTWNGSYFYAHNGSSNQKGQSVAFTKAYIFTMANINQWTTAVVSLKNSLPTNSIQVDRAFLNFGNLASSPWYVTLGNAYLPFGNFSGNGPLDNALTTNAFRINPTTEAMLGLNSDGFDTNFGVYNDSSFSNNAFHDFLLSSTWTQALNTSSQLSLGASYISDIRGTSSGVGSSYTQSTASAASPFNAAKTSAYDLNANYTLGSISLLGEFVTTSRSAMANNVSVGKPSVWMLGTVYKYAILNKPTQFQLSFSQTKNMQNVQLPATANFAQNLKITGIKSEWLASITPEMWTNTYIGPEFVYDHLYSQTNTWTLSLDATAYF